MTKHRINIHNSLFIVIVNSAPVKKTKEKTLRYEGLIKQVLKCNLLIAIQF